MAGIEGQPRTPPPRAVIVHAAAEVAAVRALAAGRPVVFLSAPGVAGYLGVLGFRALLEAGGGFAEGMLDAADAPGHALAALRGGFRAVVLAPEVPAFPALAALFAAEGAALWPAAPPALDLARVNLAKPQGRRHLARWLGLPGAEEMV
ncbi:MAG: hypothetical protein MUC89_21675 [Acetobacteraceae bacterium]|jgi:hypothetical protein|nr:hypothetical protein [Acetobacteraceae bacterium]